MHSLPPNLTVRAWAWDCGSAVPSLNRTGAACGLLTTLRAAQDFVSHYLPMARNATQLCRQIVRTPTAVTPTSRLVESIGLSLSRRLLLQEACSVRPLCAPAGIILRA